MRGGRIVVIGDPDAVLGLGLIGFEGVPAASAAEARRALDRSLRDPGVALVLLTEDWAEALADRIDRDGNADGPLVVEIPAPGGEPRGRSLHDRVRETLGIRFEG